MGNKMRRNQQVEGSGSQLNVPENQVPPRMMELKCRKVEIIPIEKPMRFDSNNDNDFIMKDATQGTTKVDKTKWNPTKKRTPHQSVISTIVDLLRAGS